MTTPHIIHESSLSETLIKFPYETIGVTTETDLINYLKNLIIIHSDQLFFHVNELSSKTHQVRVLEQYPFGTECYHKIELVYIPTIDRAIANYSQKQKHMLNVYSIANKFDAGFYNLGNFEFYIALDCEDDVVIAKEGQVLVSFGVGVEFYYVFDVK